MYLRTFFSLLGLLFLGVICFASEGRAATCSVSTNTIISQAYVNAGSCDAINISGTPTITWSGTVDLIGAGTVTIVSGTTTFSGIAQLGADDTFIINSAATGTHAAADSTGFQIFANNITVNGGINTSYMGSAGGDGLGAGQDGGCGGSGAGYGGDGGSDCGTTLGGFGFGSSTEPTALGSGGANSSGGAGSGGPGGGYVRLNASSTLTLAGRVLADGRDGAGTNSTGGGGSGGSIYIRTVILTGSGMLRANGGARDTNSGNGGGGRIAIYYTTDSSSLTISAQGGSGGSARIGGAGTIYKKSSAASNGDLTIDNGGFSGGFTRQIGSNDQTYRNVYACNRGNYHLSGSARLIIASDGSLQSNNANQNGTLTNVSSTVVFLNANTTINGVDVNNSGIFSLTNLTVTSSIFTNVATTATFSGLNSLTVGYGATTTFSGATTSTFDTLTVLNGGTVTHKSNTTAKVNTLTLSLATLTVQAGGVIEVSGKGFSADQGTGAGTRGGCAGGGGGYGGSGGAGCGMDAPGGLTYGNATNPNDLGSGGGYDDASGGGLTRIYVSGTATINGSVNADGASATTGAGGGGAGGGIWLYIGGTFAGSGSIYARGGSSLGSGGGGGGGRIAIYYAGLTATVTSSTSGGTGASTGSTGSIYTLHINQSPDAPASLGQAALTNGSTTGTNNPVFTFTLSDPDGADTVKYRIQIDDTSNFSSPVVDYTSALAAQGSRTFRVGQSAGSGSYSVGSVSQTLSDGSYYWRVKTIDASEAESSYATANSGATAFVVDTATRTVQFDQATASALESVTATSVRISIDTAHFEDVSVAYTLSGTASGGGTDYTLSAGTATILAGDTSTTVSLVVVNDAIDEPAETVVLTLSSPTYASLGTNTSLTYTITDNDVAGVTVSPTALSVSEGGSSAGYTIVLDTQPTSTVQVVLTVPADLSVSTSTLTFTSSNWSSAQTVTVTATDDAAVEGTHTASITHAINIPGTGFAYGYTGLSGISSLVATITDNDSAAQTSSNSSATTDAGGGAATAGASSPGGVPSLFTFAPSTPSLPTSNAPFLVIQIPSPPVPSPSPSSPPPSTPTSNIPKTVTISILNPKDPQRVAEVLNQGRRELTQEVQAASTLARDAQTFDIQLSLEDRQALSVFVTYGLSDVTRALGMGERRALVRDALETLGADFPVTDLERMARGIIPSTRNIIKERAQLPRVRKTFRTIYGHDPNFADLDENLAWNTLMYRIRFSRDLVAERKGIQAFRKAFGRSPSDPFQWATVRVMGYVR